MRTDVNGHWCDAAKSAGCGFWIAMRSAAKIIERRCTTGLICNDAQAFDNKGIWGRSARGRTITARQWVLAPFWGPVSTHFKAPIEHARPTGGGVAAFKLEQRGGNWQLTPAWLSRDMDLAEEAVIANGIVFTYAAGEDGTQVARQGMGQPSRGAVYGGGLSSGPVRRVPNSRRAALYALDGQTGKELWSSGNQIDSWNHFSGLTIANGRACIATFDGVLYCWNRQVSRRP